MTTIHDAAKRGLVMMTRNAQGETVYGVTYKLAHTAALVMPEDRVGVIAVLPAQSASTARSDTRMLWEVGFLTNLRLLAVVVVSVVLQIASHQVEWLGRLLRTNSMPLSESLMLVAFGLVPLVVLEGWKGIARWRAKRTTVTPTRID